MKWYLCGPMSGIPQFNFPAFQTAAKDLRASGYQIVSPHELDDENTARLALASIDGAPGSGSLNGETWGYFLSRDVKIVADDVGGLILLNGWERSRGAILECVVGLLCRKQFMRYLPPSGASGSVVWNLPISDLTALISQSLYARAHFNS